MLNIMNETSNGSIRTAVFIESGYDDLYDDYVDYKFFLKLLKVCSINCNLQFEIERFDTIYEATDSHPNLLIISTAMTHEMNFSKDEVKADLFILDQFIMLNPRSLVLMYSTTLYNMYLQLFSHHTNLVMGMPNESNQLTWSKIIKEWFTPE